MKIKNLQTINTYYHIEGVPQTQYSPLCQIRCSEKTNTNGKIVDITTLFYHNDLQVKDILSKLATITATKRKHPNTYKIIYSTRAYRSWFSFVFYGYSDATLVKIETISDQY